MGRWGPFDGLKILHDHFPQSIGHDTAIFVDPSGNGVQEFHFAGHTLQTESAPDGGGERNVTVPADRVPILAFKSGLAVDFDKIQHVGSYWNPRMGGGRQQSSLKRQNLFAVVGSGLGINDDPEAALQPGDHLAQFILNVRAIASFDINAATHFGEQTKQGSFPHFTGRDEQIRHHGRRDHDVDESHMISYQQANVRVLGLVLDDHLDAEGFAADPHPPTAVDRKSPLPFGDILREEVNRKGRGEKKDDVQNENQDSNEAPESSLYLFHRVLFKSSR